MDYGIVTTVIGVVADIIGVIAFVFDGEKWKKSTKALIVLGLVVGLVVIAVGVGLILNGGGNSGREEPDYVSSYAISSDDVSSGAPSSSASSSDTDDEKEKILDRAMRLSYIEVYPDEVNYTLSEIDIYVKSDGNILNMRSGPNDSYAHVSKVKNGKEVVKLSASKNDYTYIFDPASEKYGWVLSKYVR